MSTILAVFPGAWEPSTTIFGDLALEKDAAKIRNILIAFTLPDNFELEDYDKLPSVEWYAANWDKMKSTIDDVVALFPLGLEKPVST